MKAVAHAEHRALTRLGVRLTRRRVADIVRRIRSGQTKLLRKDAECERHATILQGEPVTVVWSPAEERIVSIWKTAKTRRRR